MVPQNCLFAFDIETIPDVEAARNLLQLTPDDKEYNDVEALRTKLIDYHLEITDGKNDFIRQLFHQIVCISFAYAEIHHDNDYEYYTLKEVRSGGNIRSQEQELVNGFFKYLGDKMPRLVSFNGRGFDLPVLKYRAMKYNVSAPWLYKSSDKWSNYCQRYSKEWHCDLMEVLSDYGTSAKVKMKEVCALLSIPCKDGIDGSQVSAVYDKGNVESIRNYCELDSLITFIIYLSYALHTAITDYNGYRKSLDSITEYILSSEKPHLEKFLEKWEMMNNDI